MDGGVEKAVDTHSVTPDDIIATARKYIGVPHCMGGTTMKCIDCSGLVTIFVIIMLFTNSYEVLRNGSLPLSR